jgi:hypothetical protein
MAAINCVECKKPFLPSNSMITTCPECRTRIPENPHQNEGPAPGEIHSDEYLATNQEWPDGTLEVQLSTGGVSWEFEPIDLVFAIDSHEQGFLSNVMEIHAGARLARALGAGGANPGKAFEKVKLQLKAQCVELGGDAVIHCQFEHRSMVAQGMFGGKPGIEIFAYGTAVKRIIPPQ